jgi:mannose-6-phosphate isomerase-like protein (cupin superfamily)
MQKYTASVTVGPIVLPPPSERPDPSAGLDAAGDYLTVGEWGGSHVGYVAPLHVHYSDDEAWHVISGRLQFKLSDREVIAEAGSTVLVPAGVPHTFGNPGPGAVRYLIIAPRKLSDLIAELHRVERTEHPEVFRRYDSELLE